MRCRCKACEVALPRHVGSLYRHVFLVKVMGDHSCCLARTSLTERVATPPSILPGMPPSILPQV